MPTSTNPSATDPTKAVCIVESADEYTLMTVTEVAERFSMSTRHIRKLVNEGLLPKVTPFQGSPIRISVAAMKRFINDSMVVMTKPRHNG